MRGTLLLAVGLVGVAMTAVGIAIGSRLESDRLVGDENRIGVVVPTGRRVLDSRLATALHAAVLDAAPVPGSTRMVVKLSNAVLLVSSETARVLSSASLPGASLTGIAVSPDGKDVLASTAGSALAVYRIDGDKLVPGAAIQLPAASVGGASYPCGVAFTQPHQVAVAASRDNSVLLVDTESHKLVRRIPVDPAPYGVTVSGTHLYVSCWARPAAPDRPSATSSGTEVEVDERGIGVAGSVCKVDWAAGDVERRVGVGLQPTEMVAYAGKLFVAIANGDQIAVLDAETLAARQPLPTPGGHGTAPNSLAIDATDGRLFVALGGIDRVGCFDLTANRWQGFARSAWYPSLVRWNGTNLVVGTAKGLGSRAGSDLKRSVGSVTATLAAYRAAEFTDRVEGYAGETPARSNVSPGAIPERVGEPSPIKHVVYIIKENRTYDQVLGDMREGNGDPKLTMYGERVTPNHHALAREFVLLDNYYCNGMLSADGHAWATEANATTFYERSRGGWTRSYPFGDDPLATSSSGYIWDNARAHGKSVMNFGEFDYASPAKGRTAMDILHDFQAGKPESFSQNIGVADLRADSIRDYPGWNLAIPDVLRAGRFIRHLGAMRSDDALADFTIVYLPQDHTSGGSKGFPSPRAQVADNDLALGQVVEALSHSRFWKSTAIFVEEDDPQDGFDHVDGYRSVCLVVSPYTKRGKTISRFYNQASVIRSMEHILGLPAMNINDAEAPLMTECFTSKADLRPYMARPNVIPLDEPSPAKGAVSFNLTKPDAVDDEKFNRRLWALSGLSGPYPTGADRR